MKRFNYFISIVLFAVLLNACKKDKPGNDPDPDPPNPPAGEEMILPKKQMRAAWIATVYELDWPMGAYDMAAQKQKYIAYLDKFKQLNMNAVFVQVKGMGDAFYNSPYEPWSVAIKGVGTRGQDPGYDVLKFMLDEAHARGLEFHAWINPFRIATRASNATPYPALHPSIQPGWVVSHEKWQLYNPAIPEARQRLADIVKDIITKYDVDGIHMDDYFYPDPSSAGVMVSDATDYATYGAGYATIQDFRRGNVDKAIKGVYDVIVANKPGVVFSISPTSNFDYNKNTLYADIVKWATEGWMDVVIPQIYQHSDFGTRLNNWDMFNNKPYLMVGHAIYTDLRPTPTQLANELNLIKSKKAAVGSLFYSAKYLNTETDLVAKIAEMYTSPAVIPFLGRAVAPDPAAPQNVRIEGNTLKWSASGNVRSVVYFTTDMKSEAKILTITGSTQADAAATGFYSVSTLNADNKESAASKATKK